MTSIPALLVLLGQLLGCLGDACSFSIEREFPPLVPRVTNREIYEVVPLSDDEVIVVSHSLSPIGSMDVTHVGPRGDELIVSTPALMPSGSSPIVIGTEAHWWLSRIGFEGRHQSVYFVERSDANRMSRIDVGDNESTWLPLRGAVARGILVTVSEGGTSLAVSEVSPAGAKELAVFAWRRYEKGLSAPMWSAEALPDGRIAIVSVDDLDEANVLRLRVVSNGVPIERTLPCPARIDRTLGTAVDASGRIAIVARTDKGEIVAMILDIDHPDSSQCRQLSAPGEVAAELPYASPSVVFAGDRFVAAWIRDDRTIRACELERRELHPVVVDVAVDAELSLPYRQLLLGDGSFVRFVWKDRGGSVMTRRMPRELSSLALFLELQRLGCGLLEPDGATSDRREQAGDAQ